MKGPMKEEHVHKYQRVIISSGKAVFKCMLAGCRHYMLELALCEGRNCLCWRCGEEFTLTKEHLERRKPVCPKCKGERKQKIEEFRFLPELPRIGA